MRAPGFNTSGCLDNRLTTPAERENTSGRKDPRAIAPMSPSYADPKAAIEALLVT